MSSPSENGANPPPHMKSTKSLAPLRSLWPWIRPHAGELIRAFCAILVVAAALLMLGRGIAFLVDSGLGGSDAVLLDRAVLVCIAIAGLLAGGSYFRAVLINRVAEKVIASIRKAAFAHVLGLSAAWFERARSGDVIARLTADTAVIQTVVGSSLSMALRNLIVLAGGVAMMALTSPKLTLVILAVIPFVVLPVILIARRLRRASRIVGDRLGDVSVEAEEALTAIATIQAFGRADFMHERFAAATDESYNAAARQLALRGVLSASVILLVFSAIAVLLWMGGRDLIAGRMSAGDLSAFVFYAALVAASVATLTDIFGELQRAAGAAARIADLLDQPRAIISPPDPEPLPPEPGGLGIRFENVDFHYESRPAERALSGVNLDIKPAERIAIVGPSGAGKSTLLALILRLIDPAGGRVLVGGVDARAADLDALRGAMGLVAQETALFSGSVAENILFGNPAADFDAMVRAARLAHADGFIDALPAGYDTALGAKGVQLSGGQRQRIAIARALLRAPRILLLDEATSSLDARSEQAVQAALETLMAGRTTVVIAHRLATVLGADRIIVMDKGRIIASGGHEELLLSCPLYHDLASLQLVAGNG